MKGFDKLHIKSAIPARSKMDLSKSHLTTLDFGQILPLYFAELVPGDRFSIQASYFSRMAPLVKPTYGKFYFKTASFFTPMYQLADDAEAFISGSTVWEGSSPKLRYINYYQYTYFLNSISTSTGSGNVYDWSYINSTGTIQYRKFTGAGKFYLKILHSLGYTIPQNVDWQPSSTWWTNFATKTLSAMPILAFCKAYNDYMSQSQRYNSSTLTYALKCIKHNAAGLSGYSPTTRQLDYLCLTTLFSNIKLCYENDYFTSAWRYPSNALSATEDVNQFRVPEGGSVDDVYHQVGDVYLSSDGLTTSNYSLSQRSLDYLRKFADWVRRNNYSGSRIVQKVYSRFGIKTEDFRSNYAQCIGTSATPLQIGDVTATSSANVTINSNPYTNVVGDYAGKGIVNDGTNISYQASDYGYLMIFGYYTVAPMMSYGFDRSVLHVDPFDFYTPEFDGLGGQAISYGEVFSNPIPDSQDTTLDDSVFGFTERYNEYRYPRDVISGEFRDYHSDGDMNVWHSGRLLNEVREDGQMQAQSVSMNTLANTDSEYNRIFSVVDGAKDHFYMIAKFNVDAVRPMKSLNQVPDLGEGDTVVDKNGNVIN